MIAVSVESDLSVESELRQLRKRVQRVLDVALDEPERIVIRTLDSLMATG